MYYEWALLDTHDGTTDFYKHYRNESQIHKHLEKIGAEDIEVNVGGNGVEAFCRKPSGLTEAVTRIPDVLAEQSLGHA